jgi:hypothetical protein
MALPEEEAAWLLLEDVMEGMLEGVSDVVVLVLWLLLSSIKLTLLNLSTL